LETHYNFNNDKNLSSTKLLLDLTTDYKMDNGFKVNSNLKAYHDFILLQHLIKKHLKGVRIIKQASFTNLFQFYEH
jgi:hypothetical protein